MAQKTDFELIEAFKKGDVSGFNELVKRYQERVYWIARRTLGTHEDADDIAQEVFIRVYKKIKDFRGESNFYTWLYRVAINVSLNALRKRKIKNAIPYGELLDDLLPSDSKTDEMILQQEYETILEQAIKQLPNKQNIVFNMRFYDELPFEDMAKILKKSVGGTKANYFHAVKNISEYVKRKIGK